MHINSAVGMPLCVQTHSKKENRTLTLGYSPVFLKGINCDLSDFNITKKAA